jgi:hypothetical protein
MICIHQRGTKPSIYEPFWGTIHIQTTKEGNDFPFIFSSLNMIPKKARSLYIKVFAFLEEKDI